MLMALTISLTAAFTAAVRRYAIKKSLMDIPNERSSHDVPTPSGGGVAMVMVFFGISLLYGFLVDVPTAAILAVLGGGALVAGIGCRDDYMHVAARWRLVVHFTAALFALMLLGGLPDLSIGSWVFTFGWVGYIAGAVLIVWLLNLYNFMDGIDGIAGIELLTVAGGAALLLMWQGMTVPAGWLLLLGACGAGFLVWNWPPAKIFMGDAGSGFLGFSLAVFAIWTGSEEGIGLWAWLILMGIFLVDATWTLVRRVTHGQRFYQAHRIHAYQYAARWFGAHRPVTVGVGLINLFWLLPLAAIATTHQGWGLMLVFVAWAPLMGLCWWFRAGVPEEIGDSEE
jgi:Fuc2NAc and GlcNAc transferase